MCVKLIEGVEPVGNITFIDSIFAIEYGAIINRDDIGWVVNPTIS